MSETRLILHVKGTQAETAELTKDMVRAAISQGDLTHSQLIWSKADHAWKQAREFPDLISVPNAVPVPLNAATPAPVPVVAKAVSPTPLAQPQVKVMVVQPQMQSAPKVMRAQAAPVAVAPPSTPTVTNTQGSSSLAYQVKEEDHFHPMKWVCIVLGALILLTLTGNYFLVQQPLGSNLRQTDKYYNAPAYAHFGAFFQPNVIVIHVRPSSTITPDNLTDFLVTLAGCTPNSPVSRDGFTRVALTSGWTAQYSFSGYSWRQLAGMKDDSPDARKDFILAQLGDAGGEPLIHSSTLNEAAQKVARDQVWQTFVDRFTTKQ